MPSLGPELIGGFVFSSIGLVAFVYGKRMQVWKAMFIGIALMVYPYFVESAAVLYVLGTVLSASVFLFRG